MHRDDTRAQELTRFLAIRSCGDAARWHDVHLFWRGAHLDPDALVFSELHVDENSVSLLVLWGPIAPLSAKGDIRWAPPRYDYNYGRRTGRDAPHPPT